MKKEEKKDVVENNRYKKNAGNTPGNTLGEESCSGLDSSLNSLVKIMEKLRFPGGCPWDRKQTHSSLRPYLIEEAYEVVHAIDQGNSKSLCEELGDLLLQIVFHSQLAAEEKAFTLQDVIDGIKEKIIRRHPHVFGQESIKDAESVSIKWSEIKKQEKNRGSLFYNPEGLPALKRAQKVQQQAARQGFDWDNIEGPWQKIFEELKELQNVYNKENRDKIEEEVGDLIFAVVNVSRYLEVDAELALSSAVEKFLRRMRFIEERVKGEGRELVDYNLEQLDKLWNDAKKKGL